MRRADFPLPISAGYAEPNQTAGPPHLRLERRDSRVSDGTRTEALAQRHSIHARVPPAVAKARRATRLVFARSAVSTTQRWSGRAEALPAAKSNASRSNPPGIRCKPAQAFEEFFGHMTPSWMAILQRRRSSAGRPCWPNNRSRPRICSKLNPPQWCATMTSRRSWASSSRAATAVSASRPSISASTNQRTGRAAADSRRASAGGPISVGR